MPATWIPLSRPRRLVCDLLHFAAGVPTVPVQRQMRLGALVDARGNLDIRPSWTAIFTKAFAVVAAEMPELRRAYIKWPWPHLVEYETSSASIAFERDYQGEQAVLFGRVKDPASMTLSSVTKAIRLYVDAPLTEMKDFRRALRIAGLPLPIRRLAWWIGLNSARKRIRHFGTFGVSVYSGLGAESLHPLSPLTTLLNYGVIAPDGTVDVRLVYDHRVMDGATIARALLRMEEVLTGPLLRELQDLASTGESTVKPSLVSRSR